MVSRWLPVHEGHAIELCMATFQFGEPVTAKAWQAIAESISAKARDAGFEARSDTVELNLSVPGNFGIGAGFQVAPMGLGPGAPQLPGQPPSGPVSRSPVRILSASDDGGPREQVYLRRDHVAYASMRYPGWSAFSRQAGVLLAEDVERIIQLVDVHSVKLECWDRFTFEGEPAEAEFGELFELPSGYLPGFPKGSPELWHSHVGAFVPGAADARRLVNLNVDIVDLRQAAMDDGRLPGLKRSAGIYTMVRDEFRQGYMPSGFSQVAGTLDGLHVALKEVFSEVITSRTADMITLNPEQT